MAMLYVRMEVLIQRLMYLTYVDCRTFLDIRSYVEGTYTN